jgi:hypothetical protein
MLTYYFPMAYVSIFEIFYPIINVLTINLINT